MDAMSVVTWILFGYAVLSVVVSFLLFVTLRLRMLNFHEDPTHTVLFAMIPSVFVLAVAVVTIVVPAELTVPFAIATFGGLVVLTVFCVAAAGPLIEAERALNTSCIERVGKTVRWSPDNAPN